jgi:hypothetical protein
MGSNNSKINQKKPDVNTTRLQLIIPNLYLGGLSAFNDIDLLKELKITHVLSFENPIDPNVQKQFICKSKFFPDDEFSNILEILEECIEFINDAIIKEANIFVHWYLFV